MFSSVPDTVAPPIPSKEDNVKLLPLIKPVPKVTGSFVVVSMDNVPAVASMIGVVEFRVRLPERVVFEVTARVELNVVAPVTPRVPPTVAFPVDANVVNLPVDGVVAPIGVLSMEPPVNVAPDEAKLFAVVAPKNVLALYPLWV